MINFKIFIFTHCCTKIDIAQNSNVSGHICQSSAIKSVKQIKINA